MADDSVLVPAATDGLGAAVTDALLVRVVTVDTGGPDPDRSPVMTRRGARDVAGPLGFVPPRAGYG